jgi:hypothetical protein
VVLAPVNLLPSCVRVVLFLSWCFVGVFCGGGVGLGRSKLLPRQCVTGDYVLAMVHEDLTRFPGDLLCGARVRIFFVL